MTRVGIFYWSGAGNTERMANQIAQGASEAGAEIILRRVDEASAEDLDGLGAAAFGSPASSSERVEESEMTPFLSEIAPRLPGMRLGIFGSHGWGDGQWLRDWARGLRDAGAELMDDGLAVREASDGAGDAACAEWGKKLAAFADSVNAASPVRGR